MWGCRAASPLAAVAVCGGGKVPGRDESLPYGLNRKRDLAVGCGQNHPEALLKMALGEEVTPAEHYTIGRMFIRYSYDMIVDISQFQQISTTGEI